MMKQCQKIKFTGIATQQQCNRKLCQFNMDEYCTTKKGETIHEDPASLSRFNTEFGGLFSSQLERMMWI